MAEHSMALARLAHHATKRAERSEQRLERHQSRTERVIGKIVRSGEVFAGAALAGIIQGKAGHEAKIGPVPIDLAIGVVLNGVSLWAPASEHLNELAGNLGDGFLAGYGAEAGFAVGQRWKATGRLFGSGAPLPAPAPPPGQPAVHGELDPRVVAAQIINGNR